MDEKVAELNREQIIAAFPELLSDANFEITSKATPVYNCIAWAYSLDSKWMWPKSDGMDNLDALQFWPDGIENSEDVRSFISAFETSGYRICDTFGHEEGFQKIALYVEDGTTNCTHAAREIVGDRKHKGKWTSKLGESNDIYHTSPCELEGPVYGRVYCILKREWK